VAAENVKILYRASLLPYTVWGLSYPLLLQQLWVAELDFWGHRLLRFTKAIDTIDHSSLGCERQDRGWGCDRTPELLEISSSEHEISSSEHEISSSEHEISSLEHEISSLEHEISSLEHEISSLEHEISSLECDRSNLAPQETRFLQKTGFLRQSLPLGKGKEG
jgi:hypothetical protein